MKKNILMIITVGAFLCSYGKSEINLNYNSIYKITSLECDNCDELLDEYEEFLEDYMKLAKKAVDAQTSDPSAAMAALQEATGLMTKAQSINTKLEEMKGEFSSSQMKRFTDIAMKFATSASSMY